jgi:hypothetical protein
MVGYPKEYKFRPVLVRGKLKNFTDKMLKYDIYSDYGNSGSPIYFID